MFCENLAVFVKTSKSDEKEAPEKSQLFGGLSLAI